MATNKPDLTRVWANGAPPSNVVDPDTTTPGKVAAGWQAEVPPFEHFNFLQKWFTQGLAHFNEQGIGVWDSNSTYPIDGLAKGSDGEIYKCYTEQSGNDPTTDDGTNWRKQNERSELHSNSFGVVNNGVDDSTSSLLAFLSLGGDLYIDEGTYLIDYDGPDSGGVYVTLLKSTRVRCHYNAKFIGKNDNDMIRFTVPSNGAGLPAEKLHFSWKGGFFDQTDQYNSTVLPFSTEYPPIKLGNSSTCDALSVRGSYNDGDVKGAIYSCLISDVDIIAGDHWEIAGGDSGIFVGGGIQNKLVTRCNIMGSRDLAIYMSGEDGLTGEISVVTNNTLVNCFHAVASKRSTVPIFTHNTIVNCVRALQDEYLNGDGSIGGTISNNVIESCGTTVRAQRSTSLSIYSNYDKNHGATLNNGDIESFVGLFGIQLQGCYSCEVTGNTFDGENPDAVIAYPADGKCLNTEDYNTIKSTGCSFENNVARNWRRIGTDNGDANTFIDNWCPDGTSTSIVESGTNMNHIAKETNGQRYVRKPIQHNSSSFDEPVLSRRGDPTVGIYYATGKLGLGGSVTELSGNLLPRVDNSSDIGSGALRINTIHLVNAPSVTSDETLKSNISTLDDKVLNAWSKVEWCQFKYKESILNKGEDKARIHVGIIAQKVIEAFESEGLNAFEFSLIRKVEWVETEEDYDDKGNIISEKIEAGSRYEIVYEEALSLEAALLRREINKLRG